MTYYPNDQYDPEQERRVRQSRGCLLMFLGTLFLAAGVLMWYSRYGGG